MTAPLLQHIRQSDWLTPERVRGYAVILGIASLALLVNSYLKAMGPDGTDFLAFWGAGHLTVGGDPALAYHLVAQEQVQTGTGSEGWFAFVNPPPFLFAAAPFGALPFPLAWIAWVVVTFALWAWAGIKAFPRLWPIVLVFPGALLAAGHAQTGLLTGALLVGAVASLGQRPLLAGALIGALVIKPHLAILIPFWLAGAQQWRAFFAAAASAIGLLLLSWMTFGTATMVTYADSWNASAAIMRAEDPEFYLRMATLYSQLRLFVPVPIALAVNAAVALVMIVLAFLSWKRFGGDPLASGALVLAATALTSPYLFNYDLPFLILPILWLVHEGLRQGFRDFEKLGLVLLFLAPYATRAAALPLGVNLMPLASLALVWLIWSRGGRN
ncbi:glycosyltransferase family 87 protein [Aurantiacibacter sp. MUD61]|uniref:glycosyltransferase family 87 protein n=1 Tax=Aurantiacibacter sp. MUD61 TaxID=3009083 RepID=UPI0022F13131|nr:glycosyltransferase family 87 protein [Aurantiacibacter sp. MUD61]